MIRVIEAMLGSVVPLAMFFEKVCSPQQKDSPGGFSYCWPGRKLFSAFDFFSNCPVSIFHIFSLVTGVFVPGCLAVAGLGDVGR